MTIPVVEFSEADMDYMDYIDNEEREADLIRDLHQENIEETCFELKIKDLKTGKNILKLVTDQITMDQEFDLELEQDVMTLKILLSDDYVEENGDSNFMEDLEEFSKEYEEE